MAKVTYFLGAGASFNCLPTYANFSARFKIFQDFIEAGRNALLYSNTEHGCADNLFKLCQQLEKEFAFHNTPDTVAKKYFHLKNKGEELLKDLKILLTLFFIYEQCLEDEVIKEKGLNETKAQIEKRYDSFIAAILKPVYGEICLNPEFKILTWNYDLQFEICFKNYLANDFLSAQREAQSIPAPKTIKPQYRFDSKNFAIVHLNGVAYSEKAERFEGDKVPFGSFLNDKELLLKNLLHHYESMLKNDDAGNRFLNFAWERHPSFPQSKDILNLTFDCAITIAQSTEVLVIIGYSFPIFNRDVDLQLFKSMTNLTQIYVQSPNGETLKKSIIDIFHPVNNKIHENSIDVIENLDYFHIPHEANIEVRDKYIII